MATNRTQADWAKTALRLPRELHVEVHQRARAENRSFNGHIVAVLQAAMQPKTTAVAQ